MSTLNNSLWSVSCNGSDRVTDAVKFFAGGKAIIAFPNGSTTKGIWTEAADGHFILQAPISPGNPDEKQVYVGMYQEEVGAGYCCEVNNICCGFTMKRES